jgi:hypothetical protein
VKVKKLLLALATFAAFAATTPVLAAGGWVGNYWCQVDGKGPRLHLNVDPDHNVLTWRNKRYVIHSEVEVVPDICGKAGWHVEGNGQSFDFCVATKGAAGFTVAGHEISCDQFIEERCKTRAPCPNSLAPRE